MSRWNQSHSKASLTVSTLPKAQLWPRQEHELLQLPLGTQHRREQRRAPHLPQLVLLLHLAGLVEVVQPGRHVQAPLGVLLGVGLRGGQLGAADGELHAGFLICKLLNGAQQTTTAAAARESSTV